ncbi:hypothetical protein YC2023_031710 [Brassica napus]
MSHGDREYRRFVEEPRGQRKSSLREKTKMERFRRKRENRTRSRNRSHAPPLSSHFTHTYPDLSLSPTIPQRPTGTGEKGLGRQTETMLNRLWSELELVMADTSTKVPLPSDYEARCQVDDNDCGDDMWLQKYQSSNGNGTMCYSSELYFLHRGADIDSSCCGSDSEEEEETTQGIWIGTA